MMDHSPKTSITLAITGASGFQYGWRLLQALLSAGRRVYLLVSDAAFEVAAVETQLELPRASDELAKWLSSHFQVTEGQLLVNDLNNWHSAVASGSGAPHSMVVCPCSSGTLSAIATGAGRNLVHRAADVAIKEHHQLILVPREMPLSAIHLEHMLSLSRLGVTIAPASPGFYHQPQNLDDLVDFVVARILSHLDIPQDLLPPWGH
jgi:4-hydroxy-3-polyprenylbenzoate decarboxylase